MAGTNLGSGLEEVSPDVTPNPPVPPPQVSAPMVPTPPPSGNPPMSESLGMPANMAPKPPIPPAVADAVHHNILGRAVSALMGNQTDYKVDPNTGATVAVPSKPQPGDIWRHIVAGAILGGAVGGQQPAGGSPVAAGLAGAQAVQAQGTAQDAQRYQRAQEGAKTQLETKKVNQELLFQQAQIAHMHKEDMRADAVFDLMNPIHLDNNNQFNKTVEDGARAAGGSIAPVIVNGADINGKAGNGPEFAAAYAKNPQAFDAPKGYSRIHTQSVDTNGLHYELGKGWLDDKGQYVDLSNRTTHTFYDVPQDAFKQKVDGITHKQVNQLAGFKAFPDDNDPVNITFGDLINLKTNATKQSLEQQESNIRTQQLMIETQRLSAELGRIGNESKKENAAEDNAKFERLRQTTAELRQQKKELDAQAQLDPTAKAEATALQRQIDAGDAAMAAFTAGPAKPGTTPAPAPATPAPAAASQRNGVTLPPEAARVYDNLQKAKSMPTSYDQIDEIPALTTPSSKLALAAAAGVSVPWAEVVKLAQGVNQAPADFARLIESNGGKVEAEAEAPAQAAPLAMR